MKRIMWGIRRTLKKGLKDIKGENTYTKYRLPVEMIFYAAFSNKYKAIDFEKYRKSGSGKAFAKRHLY